MTDSFTRIQGPGALLLVTFLASVSAAAAKPVTAKPADDDVVVERIVATVDHSIVLLSEVDQVVDELRTASPPKPGTDLKAWRKARQKEVLDGLIAEKLIEREIRKLHVDVTDEEIDRVVEGTMAQYKLDRPHLEQALAQQGLNMKEYRDGLRKQLMKAKIIQLKVKNRVSVTDQDVKSHYARNQAVAQENYRVKARHILFLVKKGAPDTVVQAAKLKAEQAKERVLAGENFAKVAKEVSEGPSAKVGGSLGTFGRGEMVPAFERAAFAAKIGEVVGPVRSPFGWHLILVEERVIQKAKSLSDIEGKLREQLYQEEVEVAFKRYIEELKADAYIEVRL